MTGSVAAEPMKNGFFYGWVIVVASCIIVAMGMGMMFSFGVFLKPLQEHFDWTRASISFSSSISWWAVGASSLVFGFLSDRIGTRKVVIAGAVVYSLGLLLTSRIEETWHLYITFGVMTGVGNGAFYVPLTAEVAKWFSTKRGIAIATVSAGNGLGVLIFSPLSRYFINTVGWRWAYVILGLAVIGVVIPLSILLRRAPVNGLPDPPVIKEDPGNIEYESYAADSGIDFRAGVKTSDFWVLTVAHFLGCIAFSGPVHHLVANATDVGIPKMVAATIFGFMGTVSAICRIGSGHIADRVGTKKTLIAFLIFLSLAVYSFILAREIWSYYIAGILFGVASGSIMPLFALILREYYGLKAIGALYGLVFLIVSLGIGLGAYFGGYIFDVTGSYLWLYIITGTISIIAALVVSTMRHPAPNSLT